MKNGALKAPFSFARPMAEVGGEWDRRTLTLHLPYCEHLRVRLPGVARRDEWNTTKE